MQWVQQSNTFIFFINIGSEINKKLCVCHYWTTVQNKENSMNFELEDLKLNPISPNLIQQIWMSMY